MIPVKNAGLESQENIPRVGGDDPIELNPDTETKEYSPRPQGTAPTPLCRGYLLCNTHKNSC